MRNGDPNFPLLRLPQNEILRVLKSMGTFEIILFSFSTKKSKTLVESAGLNPRSGANIIIGHGIGATVFLPNQSYPQWTFYRNEFQNRQPNQVPMNVAVPGSVTFSCEGKSYELTGMLLTLKEWIDHIKTIFHTPEAHQLWFLNDEGFFNIESIRDAVGKMDSVQITSPGTDEQNQEKMKAFILRKRISLGNNVWQVRKPPGSVLLQNFDTLEVGDGDGTSSMALDDLIIMNGKWNHAALDNFTEKDMNRYLKLWISGRCSCKMEQLMVQLTTQEDWLNKSAVLKGIQYQEVDKNKKRWYKCSTDDHLSWPIEGGYDIRRRDGTRATILFDDNWVEMYVWHDYCIVDKE